MVLEPLTFTKPARMAPSAYPPAVEQWRPLAEQYFPPDQVDKILYLINGESGGNPDAVGDGGLAKNLFQSHYLADGATPEQAFADARRLYDADLANGGTGYGDWGEGRLYQGQPFGALGANPYASAATGTSASASTSSPPSAARIQPAYSPAALDTTADTSASTGPLASFDLTSPAYEAPKGSSFFGGIARELTDTAGGLARSVSNAFPDIRPLTDPITKPVVSAFNTGVDALSDAGNFTARVAKETGKDILESPFFRINVADQIAAALDDDPTTSPAGVAVSQVGPVEDQQYPLGQSLPARVARNLTNPAQFVGAEVSLPAAGLDVLSAVTGPIGEELAPKIGVSPQVGGIVASGLPYAGSGIRGAIKSNVADEPTGAAANAASKASPTPLGQLIENVQSAGAARPDLLATRKAEFSSRLALAAADLEAGGVSPRDAFARARQQLAGELADPSFNPIPMDTEPLYQQILDYQKANRDFFTANTASVGLHKLESGLIPPPSEIEALGKVFGPELQTAITDLGDVFKVKRAVEDAFTGRGEVPITLGPAGELDATNITAAVKQLLPKASSKSLQGAVQRLIDEDRLVATVVDGKPVLRLRGPQFNTLSETVRGLSEGVEPVPEQIIPPAQPELGAEGFQPSFANVGQITKEPGVLDIPPATPATGMTLEQMRLYRSSGPGFRGEGASIPPPRNPAPGSQGGFGPEWNPRTGKPVWQKSAEFALELMAGLGARVFQTAYDLSFPFRQGGLLIANSPEWTSNFKRMLRAFGNEDFARARMEQIKRAPYNPKTLDITDYDPGSVRPIYDADGKIVGERNIRLTEMEESFMSRLANVIPGIRQSNRAATVFINGLRSDVANSFVRAQLGLGRDLPSVMKDAEKYASFLNRATGRGNIGRLESSLPALNQVFYAFRNNVALIQAPFYLFNSSPAVRKAVWKDFLGFMGVGMATLTIAKLAGAEVGTDPDDADFGKIKAGNTRVDIWGGRQQLVRMVYKLSAGQIKDPLSSEALGDAILPYIGNKLAPTPSFAVNQYDKAREIFQPGQQQDTLPEAVAKGYGPLGIVGLVEAIREEGAIGGALAVSGLFGTGVQTYTATEDIGIDEIADGVQSGNLPATYLDKNGQEQPVTNLRQLNAADPEAADKFLTDNPKIAKERYKAYGELTRDVRDRQQQLKERQTERDSTLLATNPAEWRRASSEDANLVRAQIDALYEAADEYKRDPESLLDVAQQKYHEAIVAATDKKSQSVDWDAVDRVVADFTPAEQELIFKSSLKGETETRKQYLRDIKQLEPYFEERDIAWKQISSNSKTLGQYATFDDFRQSVIDKVFAKTGSHSMSEQMADDILGDIAEIVSLKATAYLGRNRNLVPMLDKWGFFVPSILRPLTYQRAGVATLESP